MGSSILTVFEAFEHAFVSGDPWEAKSKGSETQAAQQTNPTSTRIINDDINIKSKTRAKTVRREVRCLLFRDILSVVTGLRPAVLLDYLVVNNTSLKVQIDSLWRGICVMRERICDQKRLRECCLLIVDHNCILVARTDTLLDSDRLPFPLCVGFGPRDDDDDVGVFKAYWLDGEERNVLVKQIELLRTSIQSTILTTTAKAVRDRQRPLQHSKQIEHVPELSSGNGTCPAVVIDLQRLMMDGQFDLLQMPTVNGWLLGYPLTYHVKSIEHAEKICRFLSSTTLSWYSVRTDLRFQVEGKEAATRSVADEKKIQLTIDLIHRTANTTQLLGFSVPKYLIENDGKGWWGGVMETWKKDNLVISSANNKDHIQRYWTEPQLFVESRMTGVLL